MLTTLVLMDLGSLGLHVAAVSMFSGVAKHERTENREGRMENENARTVVFKNKDGK